MKKFNKEKVNKKRLYKEKLHKIRHKGSKAYQIKS